MLRRAIDRRVSSERIAAALNVDVTKISKKMKLLDGICDEAAELLKDHTFSPASAATSCASSLLARSSASN